MNKFYLILFCALLAGLGNSARAQVLNCALKIEGIVIDEHDREELTFATVIVEEFLADRNSEAYQISDGSGYFRFENLCPGEYHLLLSHVGCETVRVFVDLQSDTNLTVKLEHHAELLDVIKIEEDHNSSIQTAQAVNRIALEELTRSAGKPLSEIVESIPGVSAIKSGSGISKPVIHGMYGNRVLVLNNGLAQAGQQWGNDHAPEIDPSAAMSVSVIKGANTVEYAGNSLGGVLVIDQGPIELEPHLHGQATYRFASNGLGQKFSARLQQGREQLSWRLTASGQFTGDRSAPNYYLRNTGDRVGSASLALEKKIGKWSNKFYYSYYNTQLGILRGAHIGNLTDLELSIDREEPFYTETEFSYRLEPPRQEVTHQLLKLETTRFFNEHSTLSFRYGLQHNKRKEFDIRRGDRSSIPALSLALYAHQVRGTYSHFKSEQSRFFKTGIVVGLTDNTNNPETGILPLIPDYYKYEAAVWASWSKGWANWEAQLGARAGINHLRLVTFSQSIPVEVERFEHTFANYSLGAGLSYSQESYVSKLDLGVIQRAPEINELRSFGLHQGVSGIEIGSAELNPEQSMKAVWTNDLQKEHFFAELSVYAQYVGDYIYLEPQDELRLTIRGSFPVFEYKQTDAIIRGIDLLVKWEPGDHWEFLGKAAFLQGDDLSEDQPLIYMPSNNLFGSVGYLLASGELFRNTSFALNGNYVFRQNRLEEGQDFLPAPDAYFLLGASFETKFLLSKKEVVLNLQAENLLNTVYRDYLNRLRYYADEEGLDLRLMLSMKF